MDSDTIRDWFTEAIRDWFRETITEGFIEAIRDWFTETKKGLIPRGNNRWIQRGN